MSVTVYDKEGNVLYVENSSHEWIDIFPDSIGENLKNIVFFKCLVWTKP